jgi:hypothetical protein
MAICLSNSRGELKANAVFLHGLGGHPLKTWQATSNRGMLWPRWLAEDINGLAIWSVGYDATISRLQGTAMHLVDRAENMLRHDRTLCWDQACIDRLEPGLE